MVRQLQSVWVGSPFALPVAFSCWLAMLIFFGASSVKAAGEGGCVDECENAAHAFLEECMAAGGENCEGQALEQKEACIAEFCEEPPPEEPPPGEPGCEDLCEIAAHDAFEICIGEEGSTHDACEAAFDAEFHACLVAECEDGPPPEPDCKDLCREETGDVFRNCIEDGGTEMDCAHQAESALHDCFQNCPDIEPPEPTCEERCAEAAAEAGDDAEEVLAMCLELCDGPPPPPDDPTCKEICHREAEDAVHACLENGGDGGEENGHESECFELGEEILVNCLRERECHPEPPPDLSCVDKCELHAREIFDLCTMEGGTEEECGPRAEEAFRNCVHDECRDDEPPPEPGCLDLCEEEAAGAFGHCIEEGNPEGECHEHLQAVFRECKETHCDEPPPEPSCEDECGARGDKVFGNCLEAGGSEEDCRHRSKGIVHLCLVIHCGDGNPCENRCALAAQVVLVGCSLAGLPHEQCRDLANLVLEACVADCGPPLPCPERCEALGHRATEECLVQGGTADECATHGAEVEAECLPHCEDPPPHSCDIACEEKAAAIEADCLADGAGPEHEQHCAMLSASFLQECIHHHGEDCTRDAQLKISDFQHFRRGDANGDGRIDIGDAISILAAIFRGEPKSNCDDAADTNDDGEVDIADPVNLLLHIFKGSRAPAPPYTEEGQDPTWDLLTCRP